MTTVLQSRGMEERAERASKLALIVITIAAAWLRFRALGDVSLWLDELLNVDIVRASHPWWSWLIGFEPENGPLYFALQKLAHACIADVELAARIVPAIVGTLTVPLFHRLARACELSRGAALVAASLLAASPLHVYYSREGRGYAVLLLAVILMMLSLRTQRPRIAAPAALLIATFTAATAAPLLVATFAVGAVKSWKQRRAGLLLIAFSCAALLFFAVLYLRHARPATDDVPFRTPPLAFLMIVANGFTATAREVRDLSALPIVVTAVAMVGCATLLRRRRFDAAALSLLTLPIAVAALIATHHWFSIRYALLALPGFLLCVAAGCDALLGAQRREWMRGVASALLLSAVTAVTLRSAMTEPLAKADWRRIATALAARGAEDDIVVSNAWTAASLSFYLREVGIARPRIIDVNESVSAAEFVVGRRARCWLVSAGFHLDDGIRIWMSRFSLLDLESAERVRVYYAPDLRDFLQNRATAEDGRRFVDTIMRRRKGAIDLQRDAWAIGSGWYEAEQDGLNRFRWCSGECTLFVPAEASVVSLLANPFEETSDWEVTVDGNETRRLRGKQTVTLTLEARRGAMHELRLRFSDRGPRGNDPRSLAGTLDRLALAAAIPTEQLLSLPRLAGSRPFRVAPLRTRGASLSGAAADLVERAGWSARGLREDEVLPLLRQAIAEWEYRSDEEFLDGISLLIFGRETDPATRREYARRLSRDVTRERIVGWMVRGEDFRKRYGIDAAHLQR